MKVKTVRLTSSFPSTLDDIWEKLQRLDTLQYIASPYATFLPLCNTANKWTEGEKSRFHLKLFGFIPIGVHTINVMQFDKEALMVYTNETNKFVPMWNHRIILNPKTDSLCCYTDEVELYAGWKTPVVFLWSSLFYKHRQRKWLKLLRTDKH